jgi:ribosomal protein S18 acetylase RimI-like enzyme
MRVRPIDADGDFDAVLALLQASDRSVYGDTDWTPAELRDQWDEIEPATDAWVAELDGAVAGVVHLCEVRGGRILTDGYVHPELTGRGVGSALLDVVEERARALEPAIPGGERVFVETAHLVGDDAAARLLAGRGYERVRTFFRMTASLADEDAPPVWPAGVVAGPLDLDDLPALHAAFETAFADEWGHTPRTLEDWSEWIFGRRDCDPSLSVVVRAEGEIVAFALNHPKRMGDWGWIGHVGVLPGWRRRGLGLALLYESFRRFRRTGERTVALGVDAANPTGATRLYERAGMRVLWRADVWRKELRAGA